MKMSAISEIVISRMNRGIAQRIHIPYPAELPADRNVSGETLDRWVAENISVPENMQIIGTCCGRASVSREPLTMCLIVTIGNRRPLERYFTPVRNTWADGRGGVR